MFKIIIILLAVLFASPAHAVNEFAGQTFFEVSETAQKHGIVVEPLNATDTAAIDAVVPNRPLPSAIYLLTLGNSVILILVREGDVIFSTNPIKLETINQVLGRTGA